MIKNFLSDDDSGTSPPDPEMKRAGQGRSPAVMGIFDSIPDEDSKTEEPFILSSSSPPPTSAAETVRQSGLAWSMGVVFVVSVVFMMILGWGADLLFGSEPWGLVTGIVIGSLIGFFQLFRLSSQIFRQ